MNTKQSDLFARSRDSQKEEVVVPAKNKTEKKQDMESSVDEILINKKLELFLKKYIHSFDKVHDQIELKGKLIELIRKI